MLRNFQTSKGQGTSTSATRPRERNHNCPLKIEERSNESDAGSEICQTRRLIDVVPGRSPKPTSGGDRGSAPPPRFPPDTGRERRLGLSREYSFTEICYARQPGNNCGRGSWEISQLVNQRKQVAAYEASFPPSKISRGGRARTGGADDALSYSPPGKGATEVLHRAWR
jgi:hypothetical protein